jgi:hypothetical protein
MKSRPNLPVILLVAVALYCQLSGWAAAEGPVAGMKSVGQSAPKPAQKPASAASSATPAPAAPAGPAPAPASKPAATTNAAASTPNPSGPAVPLPSDPADILRMACERLTGTRDRQSATEVQSIRARIEERVSIGGRKFRLEGSYLQGTDLRLRLELKVISEKPQGRIEGSLLEVCNGTILWAAYHVGKETRITRRDVSQILNASKTNGQINFSTVELGLGGLPALLASLDRWMKFETVTQEEIKGKKFIVLAGAWKEARRKELLEKMSKQHLPEHVPDSVRVYFEPDLLFPRRIEFLKRRGEKFEPLAEIDLLDIGINGPTDEHQFEYAPPDGARPIDVTTEYVQQLLKAGP